MNEVDKSSNHMDRETPRFKPVLGGVENVFFPKPCHWTLILSRGLCLQFNDVILYTSRGMTASNQFKVHGQLSLHGMTVSTVSLSSTQSTSNTCHCVVITAKLNDSNSWPHTHSHSHTHTHYMYHFNLLVPAVPDTTVLKGSLCGSVCFFLQIRESEDEWGVPHAFTLVGQKQSVVVAAR